jgi:hypothetical protein
MQALNLNTGGKRPGIARSTAQRYRAKGPSGWLVCIGDGYGIGLTFYPDHQEDGGTLPQV